MLASRNVAPYADCQKSKNHSTRQHRWQRPGKGANEDSTGDECERTPDTECYGEQDTNPAYDSDHGPVVTNSRNPLMVRMLIPCTCTRSSTDRKGPLASR